MIILLLPKLTSAIAAPNPLKGMLALSSLALVTLPSAISLVCTPPAAILFEVTALSSSWGVATAPSAIFELVMASSLMVTTPVLFMVASPLMVTPVATLPALPT